jgi:hypothetical protein
MKKSSFMKNPKSQLAVIGLLLCLFSAVSPAAELGSFRLLSVSDSEKLILVSQIPGKAKFLLDAASAKITLNGKPAEFKALKAYSLIQVKANFGKADKLGIQIDGMATEIRISTDNKAD